VPEEPFVVVATAEPPDVACAAVALPAVAAVPPADVLVVAWVSPPGRV
jgi:hypothetical protein